MTKFHPIVLSLLLAYASAQGCYPAYSPGTTYVAGSLVSESVSTITPYSWVACTPSDTCPTGWMQEGGVVTTSTHNFKCSTDAWCNNAGFAPGGIYSDLAWTKEAGVCSGTAVVLVPTPPPTPALWASGGCPEAYALNAQVAPGASVSVTTDGVSLVYTCTTDGNSSFCAQAGYEPGTGRYWELAWTLSGSCTGSLSPTESPTSSLPNQGGCPSSWTTSVEYRGGDKVSKNGMVFQCKDYPLSLFCPQTGYEPSSHQAIGACPTSSPTPAPIPTPPPTPALWASGGCPEAYALNAQVAPGASVSVTTDGVSLVYTCTTDGNSSFLSPGRIQSPGQAFVGTSVDPGADRAPAASLPPKVLPAHCPTRGGVPARGQQALNTEVVTRYPRMGWSSSARTIP
ncbi:hypothetical protein ACHAW5_003285 [Stephanodiscus triporus]|uniref:Ig-like domain-containing protein n=1 Tax=Stephanodiscus triporus TaxID=2934178 RepID=A0ABD3MZI6_9STRA